MEVNNNLISIIVPTYKNPTCLKHCIDSFIQNMDMKYQQESGNKVEMIIVVDGYYNLYKDLFNSYGDVDDIDVLVSTENKGFPIALNSGSELASGNLLLHINDDNVLPKNYNKIIYDIINSDVGLFDINRGCLTFNQIERNPSIFNFFIKDLGDPITFDLKKYTDYEITIREPITQLTDDGEIFPFLISKLNYMKVGGFDISYKSPFVVDWDFFLKLELIGCTFKRTRALNFYHFGSISTKNGDESERFNESEKLANIKYKVKWGFQPIRYNDNSHLPKDNNLIYLNKIEVK